MKPYFVFASELDQGTIGINLQQVNTITKGSVKSSGEEVTIVRLSNGKELILQTPFEEFRKVIADLN